MAYSLAPNVAIQLKNLYAELKITTQSQTGWLKAAENIILQSANNNVFETKLGIFKVVINVDDTSSLITSLTVLSSTLE